MAKLVDARFRIFCQDRITNAWRAGSNPALFTLERLQLIVIRFRLNRVTCERKPGLFKKKTMAKKITITLSDKSEKFFNQVHGTLDVPDGKGGFKCSQSDAINRCLEALADFEEHEGQDLVGWLEYKFQIYSKDKPNSIDTPEVIH
jgi:hypothetical protein